MIEAVSTTAVHGRRQPTRHHVIAWLSMLIAFLLTTATVAEDAAQVASPKLILPQGEFTTGQLIDSDEPGFLRWQADGFATPFDFTPKSVVSIHFPSFEQRPVPKGDYCFELAGGDLLFGKLAGLSEEKAELEVPLFGRIELARSSLQGIRRWGDGAGMLYLGPNGLGDWDTASPADAWRDDAGHLVTDRSGAFIHTDFQLPPRAAIEFEISWKSKPDFAVALGVEASNLAFTGAQAFRFEVWSNHLVVLRESGNEADVASVADVVDGPGRVHIIAYFDQPGDRLFVASPTGTKLADLKVTTGLNFNFPGIRITNHRGDLRLERLRIRRWDGQVPHKLQSGKSHLRRADGSVMYGNLDSYDSTAAQFVLTGDDGETRIAATDVDSIVLPAEETSARSFRAVLRDGTRLGGQLAGVQSGTLLLNCPGITAPLAIPLTELHSLLSLDGRNAEVIPGFRVGRLELQGTKLGGVLTPGTASPNASCLMWQPRGSKTASAIVPGAAGRIVYREPPPSRPVSRTTTTTERRVINRLGIIPRALGSVVNMAPQPTASTARALHLRTGDTIACDEIAIDEKGVTFHSEMTDATFVPHDKMKACDMGNRSTVNKVDKTKQERLLTLPRMQRNNPPTHLIRSVYGDYLRGRIESMDEEFVTVEVRLEPKRLKRSSIAEIIWLHSDELNEDAGRESGTPEQPKRAPTHVQALRTNGTRLTFQPQECDGKLLSGTSDVLGRCHVELADVDILLIGKQVDDTAAQLAYGRWRLQHAVDPKFVTADGSIARPLGTESELVGKPAPDFTLELLDGKSFQLSRQRGKVMVLDFWATWCGPCIQAMPQVDEVIHEFKTQDVQLVAVNLQETPEQIAATLDRLKLTPTVALDIDGVVAHRYAATAIPQTVIIDREGNVARLFVGGGSDFADQLRTALRDVVGAKATDAPE